MALDFAALMREERARFALRGASPSRGDAAAAQPAATLAGDDSDDGVPALDASARRSALRVVGAGVLASLLYAPDFITVEEEKALERAATSRGAWASCHGRRVRKIGGDAGSPGFDPAAHPIRPPWARQLCDAVCDAARLGARPNHVLVNEYPSDGGYILPHSDGPAYAPATATLSCGADCVVVFSRRLSTAQIGVEPDVPTCSVVLRRRSLLVFRDDAYVTHTHAIQRGAESTIGSAADGPCINCEFAGVCKGDAVVRDTRRVSFTVRHALPMAPAA
ncbi:hypothetical protein M885DRAFT_457014 [Pelagophyceae sp. CCMP2097]|nr:hypothetical protein M885DRAFT_457014 [Pelagophyceae sp. CCMP2097]